MGKDFDFIYKTEEEFPLESPAYKSMGNDWISAMGFFDVFDCVYKVYLPPTKTRMVFLTKEDFLKYYFGDDTDKRDLWLSRGN